MERVRRADLDVRFGFGLLLDAATYSQDAESEQQVTIEDPDSGVRDSRLLFRGRFKTEAAVLLDVRLHVRQGRRAPGAFGRRDSRSAFPKRKGISSSAAPRKATRMIKVMAGYHPWIQERSPGLDAFVPILADGLKWTGYFPERHVFFSLGVVRRRAVGGREFRELRPSGRHANRVAADRLGRGRRRCSTSR